MTFTNRHVKFNLQLSENLMWNFSKDTISLQKRQVSLLGDLTRYNAEKSLRRLRCSCVSGLNIFTWQLKCNYHPRSRRSRCYRLLNCCIRGEVSMQHRSACLCLGIWHGTMQKKSLRRLRCSCVSGLNIFIWQLKCNCLETPSNSWKNWREAWEKRQSPVKAVL